MLVKIINSGEGRTLEVNPPEPFSVFCLTRRRINDLSQFGRACRSVAVRGPRHAQARWKKSYVPLFHSNFLGAVALCAEAPKNLGVEKWDRRCWRHVCQVAVLVLPATWHHGTKLVPVPLLQYALLEKVRRIRHPPFPTCVSEDRLRKPVLPIPQFLFEEFRCCFCLARYRAFHAQVC